jgi:hypothetical protein
MAVDSTEAVVLENLVEARHVVIEHRMPAFVVHRAMLTNAMLVRSPPY